MLRLNAAALLVLTIPSVLIAAEDTQNKTREVKLSALRLNVPDSWKTAASASSMRLATFQIPSETKEADEAELAIYHFRGGGGGINDNLTRWIGQFDSDGREVRLTRGKARGQDYYVVEVSGTYQEPVGPPVLQQTKPAPGSRMLAMILILEEGVYFLKMTGDDKTVAKQADALRKAFGGSQESEEEYNL